MTAPTDRPEVLAARQRVPDERLSLMLKYWKELPDLDATKLAFDLSDARARIAELEAAANIAYHEFAYDWSHANKRAETERQRADHLEDESAALREACSRENEEICQILGRALGYPRFADDQANFPGSTDEHGVCVGEHVAVSIAVEAAKKLDALRAELAKLKGERHD